MSEFASAFKNTNFGSTNYDELILTALENVVLGYASGATISSIIEELNLIEFREAGTVVVLSDFGLQKLYELNSRRQTKSRRTDNEPQGSGAL